MTNTNISAPEFNVSLQDEISLTSAHLDNLSTLYEGYITSLQHKADYEDEMIDVTHTVREIRTMLQKKRQELESRITPLVKPQTNSHV